MGKETVLITGASSGIGEELARIFAHKHYNLIITARREERLQALSSELGAQTPMTHVTCDLGTEEGPGELVRRIEELGLKVDILINNAGVAFPGFFQELAPDQVDGMVDLNIRSLTRLSYLLLPGMLQTGAGRILNVASVASFQPGPANSVYAATKAYVLSLTEALSEDLRGTGVTVTALCPGLTKTEMIDEVTDSERISPYLIATAESVAKEGYDALMNGEVIRIPGFANQALVNWTRYTPRWLVRSWGGMFARAQSR